MKKLSFEILIPSYNGISLLKKHLPAIIANSGKDTSITVIDDGSTDDTIGFLKRNFPLIKCLRHDRNLGFTKSVNLGFGQAKSDLVILLNNDVSPQKNYLSSVFTYFEKDAVFAVTLNETTSSWPLVSFSGKLQYTRGGDKTRPRFSAWASGGSAVFRKKIWDELGGFDEIYSPGYWEDIDLGWRAWKAGYEIIWDPGAKVIHQHESTFNIYDRKHLNLIKQRNELIFNWKNITDPDLRREHFTYLFRHTLAHPGYLKVIFVALKESGKIGRTQGKLSDQEIFSLVNQPLN